MSTSHSVPSYFYHNERQYKVTIAYRREHAIPNRESKVIYGASFCHPSDQFNKKVGREIAEDRMNGGDSIISMPFDSKRYEVHEAILENLSSLPWTPDHY
tara:strand:- start:287 stop:586 length:300 start_codon:yes stop_codon:yes gene_type:complete